MFRSFYGGGADFHFFSGEFEDNEINLTCTYFSKWDAITNKQVRYGISLIVLAKRNAKIMIYVWHYFG